MALSSGCGGWEGGPGGKLSDGGQRSVENWEKMVSHKTERDDGICNIKFSWDTDVAFFSY